MQLPYSAPGYTLSAATRKLLAAAMLAAASTDASALTFNFNFTPGSTAQDIAGFTAAGAYWSSQFTDNVIINMDVGTAALDPGILAQAGSSRDTFYYLDVRDALAGDASSATDVAAVNSLGINPSFNLLINRTSDNPNGSGSATPYVDNDPFSLLGNNNSILRITTANAKALGAVYAPGFVDASITFSNAFSWDYDSSDGISPASFDFVGAATHEIGHALGFISGVDVLDGNSPPTNGPFADDLFTYVTTLDLFRYSAESTAEGVIDWTASSTVKYFSLDNGLTSIAGFSTGITFGDGQQASHWKDSLGLGIMDPTAAPGEHVTVGLNDLIAFDVIGWDLIPEPSSTLLGIMGSLLFLARRKR